MPVLAAYEHLLTRRYSFESRADQVHRVPCKDGVRLALKRFLPRPGAPRRNLPVLCVPGLGSDSHNFDAPGPWGLGPALAEQGYDTWVIDLRGTGQSKVPPGRWLDIHFDDFVHLDLPAAVEHICRETGREELLWVGHSMGGMVLYACLAAGGARRIRAGITLGSPVGFPQGWDCMPALRRAHFLAAHIPGLPVRRALRLLTPLCMTASDRASHRWAVRENVDIQLCRQLLFAAVQDVPRGLALQFRDWICHDAFRSRDLTVDYRARMAGARVPVLIVCGPSDLLGIPASVSRARDLLPNHEWLHLCRHEGFSADYGHIDMVFGKKAPEEVFPRYFDFLERHDEAAQAVRGRPRLRVVR